MAKIVITIEDEMTVNGLNGVTISYDGDLEPQGELTMAQMTAYNIKKLMDAVEFETAKRLSKANCPTAGNTPPFLKKGLDMWFKQVTPFRLPELPEKRYLDESLGNSWFTEPQGLDWFSEGFTHPNAFTDLAVFEAQKTMLIALKREEKVLPSAAIKHKLDEQIIKIQAHEGRNVGRKEKQELREAIIDDLLPKSLIKSSRTYGLFAGEWLFVDTANRRKAENLLTKLREALGGLPAQQPLTRQSPSALMTNWLLQGEAQGRFMLDFDVTLVGAGDVAPKVKISRKDLTAEDVVQHAKNGMKVTELGLIWNDRVAFILTQDLTLKRIQWLDVVQEEAEGSCDDAESMAYATQLLMEAALSAIIGELVDLLGGWQE